jgi:hypothetical protein
MGQSENSIVVFAELIKDLIAHDYAFVILTGAIFLWLLHKGHLGKMLFFFIGRKKQRLSELASYIATKGQYTELAKEEIEEYYFAQMTGLTLSKTRRELLYSFQKKNEHEIYWLTIKRAMPYLDFDTKRCLKVKKISFWTKVGYRLNKIFASGALLLGVGSLVGAFIGALLNQLAPADIAVLIFTFLFMMICAGFIYAQNWPLIAVEKIQTVLQNDEYVYTLDSETN